MIDNAPQTPRRKSLRERVRRTWWRWRGESPLLIVFWPQDYWRGGVYEINGRHYRITRYFHADDYRFYEVWGAEARAKHAPQQHTLPTPSVVQGHEQSLQAGTRRPQHAQGTKAA